MADAQITIVDGDQTQIVLAPGENPAIVASIPGPQGPAGAVAAAIDGSAALPSIAFASDTDTGLYRVGANQLGVSTGGTQRLVIDANGQIEATSLGTQAAPTWTFVGDPNTGIYSPGADQLALATSGTGRLFVDSSGNVGVNAASPNSYGAGYNVLTLNASTAPVLDLNVNGTRTATFYAFAANTLLGTQTLSDFQLITNATERARIRANGTFEIKGGGTAGSTPAFSVNPSATSNSLVIDSNGLTGLGTSSPAAELHINSSSLSRLRFTGGAANATNFDLRQGVVGVSNSGVSLYDVSAAATRVVVDSTGRVGLGTSTPAAPLHVERTTAGVGLQVSNTTTYAQARLSSGGTDQNAYVTFNPTGTGKAIIQISDTDRLTIDTSGRVGVGTTSPATMLDINDPGSGLRFANAASGNFNIGLLAGTGNANAYVYQRANASLLFGTNNAEVARFDSSGRLLVGTVTARGVSSSVNSLTQVETTSYLAISAVNNTNDVGGCGIALGKSRGTVVGGTTIVQSGDDLGTIFFCGADGVNLQSQAASIKAAVDGTPGASDMPGRLVFSTTADGAASPTERMRITSTGYLKASNDGTYQSGSRHEFRQTASAEFTVLETATDANYASSVHTQGVTRAANSAYTFFLAHSGGFSDIEFRLRGDGEAFADGSWTGGGADYAEYFEWSDSNPDAEDRRGISVVLDGNKIREAQAGEDPIGVISGNPSVVGDAAWNKWSGKYLRDEFGTYILDENGDRQLNPAYDPDVEYIPREERPEWDCVGLMGKLRIRKGQITGSRWVKMRDINDSVEEWLVR